MKQGYRKLGDFIRQVDDRNKKLITKNVLGINIDKYFMPSVANVIGTDLSKYKLISKNRFACNPMHVGRDERLPIALYTAEEPSIVSPAYFMFEIVDIETLNPDYLMMWFRRPEFDRYTRFNSWGSARETFEWDDMCNVEIPMPDISIQKAIADIYKVYTTRKQINEQLKEQIKNICPILIKGSLEKGAEN